MLKVKSFKICTTAGLVALSLITTACSTVGAVVAGGLGGGGGAITVCKGTINAENLYVMEAAFRGLSIALDAAAGHELRGQSAAWARDRYNELRVVRSAAYVARDACDAESLDAQVSRALVLIASLQALLAPDPQP